MDWEGYGRKLSWHTFRYYPGICLKGPRNTTKILGQNKWDLSFSRRRVWRWLSSGLSRSVVWWKFCDVSVVVAGSLRMAIAPLKRRQTSTRLHGAATQKTFIFLVRIDCVRADIYLNPGPPEFEAEVLSIQPKFLSDMLVDRSCVQMVSQTSAGLPSVLTGFSLFTSDKFWCYTLK
jgi:hypothetical protein